MTYVIGAILILLLIALVLVFKPPKAKPYQDPTHSETIADGPKAAEEELDLDIQYDGKKTVEDEEQLELTLDDAVETESPETGAQTSEEELDLTFDEPATATIAEAHEEFELTLDEDDESSEETLALAEEKGSDEFDEDIPFIDDAEGISAQKGDMDVAPALADVPDNYEQVEEDETPEELAERLEYFLGTDDEEAEPEADEASAEDIDHTAVIEEEPETAEEPVEAEPVIEAEPETSPEGYSADLQEQEKRLRGEMNAAIENRETGKLGLLEAALENLCIRQADVQAGFQQQQNLLDELADEMKKVHQALPGFQLETAQKSLREGDHEVVRTLLTEAANQLEGSPEIASGILYQWGRIEEERGELSTALDAYTKAQAGDEDNGDYLFAAGRLARVSGDTDKSLAWLEKRVSLGQEEGEESLALAMAEHELAKVLVMTEENDRVEQLLVSARETIEKLSGSEHPDLGPVLHDQAALHDSSARFEQAEPLYKKALEVLEQGLGKDDPRLGTTLNKLAGLYEEIEMEKKSEPLYTRALEIKQKVLGENHPDVGAILNHLANLLKQQGKYDQAEPMFTKSLSIAEASLGKDHPNLAVVLNNMAELYSEMGDEKQAEHYQERAFSLFGLPGADSGFVEMDKDTDYDVDDDSDQTIAGT